MNDVCNCAGVMVVDDDPDVLEITQMVLEGSGHRVLTAANGAQALELLRKCGAVPCLILLDLMMPVMDGWRFSEELEQDAALAPIPVVVVSGGTAPEEASVRAVEYMTKPIGLERLLTLARKYDVPSAGN